VHNATCHVYLGFGSNRGDRMAQIQAALSALQCAGVRVRRLSPVYETRFVGPGEPQPDYLNLVAEVDTLLLPMALLDVTQAIERAGGRPPHTHGLPRPIDIDILLYRGWCVRHPRLILPHPRFAERRFVLEPLQALGVLADWPELRQRLQELRATQQVTVHGALDPEHAGPGS
jgi:2-amino-4-hydroxy-6-hydroxymethyldihydropteridine diphosphokinase